MEKMSLTMLDELADQYFDVNIIGFDFEKTDELIDKLCQVIGGCTEPIAQHMLLHLPANVAHGVRGEEAMLMMMVLEDAGAELAIPRKKGWPDRTLM